MQVLSYSYKDYCDLTKSQHKMGFELELCVPARTDEVAFFFDRYDGFIVLKYDGSIPVDGFEVVSNPFSVALPYRKNSWLVCLQNDLKRLRNMHYIRFVENTGLHIHISRSVFDVETLAKTIWFFERNKSFITYLSKRTDSEITDYTDFYYISRFETSLELAKEGHSNRYKMINLTNDETIEFRFWRSSYMIIPRLLLTVEIVKFAQKHSEDEMKSEYFGKYLKNKNKWLYEYATKYMLGGGPW